MGELQGTARRRARSTIGSAPATALRAAVATLLAASLGGCLWPSLGHDLANSRHADLETAITPATVGDLGEAWRVDGLVGVTSTPAVFDNTVYVGTWGGAVRAFRLADGAPVWERQVTPGTGANRMVDASPLVTEQAVVVGDGRGFLHSLDRATGAARWSRRLDTHADTRIFSSPVQVGDLIIVGVASVELARPVGDFTFRGAVVGLDAAAGAERWRLPTSQGGDGAGVSVWSSAAVDEARGLAYIGTGQSYEQPAGPRSDSLLAIRYATGELAWSRQFTANDVYTFFSPPPQGPDADVGAAPNLFTAGGRDLVGVGDKAGVYAAFDRTTGETVWARELEDGSALGGVMTTAATAGGVVYVSCNVMADEYPVDAGDPRHRSVTYALDAATGEVRWQRDVPGASFGALTLAGGVLFQPTVRGTLHAFDAASGAELWSTRPGGQLGGGVSVVSGHVLTGRGFWFLTSPANPDGGLVAYDLPAG
jgi:polyvinyl alcohol dehydrogenase (cytochrome)